MMKSVATWSRGGRWLGSLRLYHSTPTLQHAGCGGNGGRDGGKDNEKILHRKIEEYLDEVDEQTGGDGAHPGLEDFLLSKRSKLFRGNARSFHASPTSQHSCGGGEDKEKTLQDKINQYLDEADKEAVGDAAAPELMGSHPDLEDILAGNKEWVRKTTEKDPDFFKRLGGKQKPRYLYIGCSDARVDPASLMGLPQGSLFVHRNVGNQVPPNDLNALTVVNFAVNHLKVPHIVVTGHYDCGAVRGSIARPEDGGLGFTESWITLIRDCARLHKDELMAITDLEERQRRLVELNVQEQCLNVFKIGCVQRRRVKTYIRGNFTYSLPRVHGLVFDPANGILKKLPLDFKKEIAQYRELYDLYQLPDWVRRRDSFKDESDPEFWDGSTKK